MSDAPKYTYTCFSYQLKTIRKAFGYTQEEAGELLGVSKSHWCAWEKNARIPDMKQVVELARIFNVDLNYFFVPDTRPPVITRQRKELQPIDTPAPVSPGNLHQFPFAETGMAKKIFSKLTEMLLVRSLAVFQVFPHSGITTILREFTNRESNSLFVINGKSYHDINNRIALKLKTIRAARNFIFLFDNAELLTPAVIAEICKEYSPFYSLAFFSINHQLPGDFNEFAFTIIQTEALNKEDFNLICKSLFPAADPQALALLRMLTDLDLVNLYNFRIQAGNELILNKDDVYNKYLNIHTMHLVEC